MTFADGLAAKQLPARGVDTEDPHNPHDHLHQFSKSHLCACAADIASRVKYGQQTFLRFPENLLNSRARYAKAFQVSFVCLSVYLSVCIHLLVCPLMSACVLDVCLSVHLSVHTSACLSVCLCICLSVHLSVSLSLCTPVHLCASLFCLSVCLSYDVSGRLHQHENIQLA